MFFISTLWASQPELYPVFLPSQTRNPDFLCAEFAEDLDLCFAYEEKEDKNFRIKKKGFQNLSPLDAYNYSMETVKDDIFERFPQIYESKTVLDLQGSYLSAIGETGLGCAAILYPQALELVLRGTPMVAFPTRDTCFIWRKENSKLEPQFHLQMAIAIRLMYEKDKFPVTKVVYEWTGDSWLPWGEAMKEEELKPTETK